LSNSHLLISSLEKVNPGSRPRFLSQKIEQNEPEKNIPSTAAKATSLSAKVEVEPEMREERTMETKGWD